MCPVSTIISPHQFDAFVWQYWHWGDVPRPVNCIDIRVALPWLSDPS